MQNILTEWRKYLSEQDEDALPLPGAVKPTTAERPGKAPKEYVQKGSLGIILSTLNQMILSIAPPPPPEASAPVSDHFKYWIEIMAGGGASGVGSKILKPMIRPAATKLAKASKSGLIQLTPATTKLGGLKPQFKIMRRKKAIKKLKHYVKTTGQGMTPKLANNLIQLAKKGKAAFFKGPLYRGVRIRDATHLTDMLFSTISKSRKISMHPDLGRIVATTPTDKFIKKQLQTAWESGGKWVEIRLPAGAKLTPQRGSINPGATSWSKKVDQAEKFADMRGSGLFEFEIMFKTTSHGKKFIDVHKTLGKAGKSVKAFRKEEEVLGVGNLAIEKVFARRKI
jgi:hypothetical protein